MESKVNEIDSDVMVESTEFIDWMKEQGKNVQINTPVHISVAAFLKTGDFYEIGTGKHSLKSTSMKNLYTQVKLCVAYKLCKEGKLQRPITGKMLNELDIFISKIGFLATPVSLNAKHCSFCENSKQHEFKFDSDNEIGPAESLIANLSHLSVTK